MELNTYVSGQNRASSVITRNSGASGNISVPAPLMASSGHSYGNNGDWSETFLVFYGFIYKSGGECSWWVGLSGENHESSTMAYEQRSYD